MVFKNYARYIFSLLASVSFFSILPFAIDPSCATPVSAGISPQTMAKSDTRQGVPPLIDEICLHEVIQGERRKILLGRKDFEDRGAIVCEGYICGVELISNNGQLAARLEDRSMNILSGNATAGAVNEAGIRGIPPAQRLYRYSYFPEVPGDAVSMTDLFSISIEGETGRYDLSVRQNGYQRLSGNKTLPSDGDALRFRYLGADLAKFESSLHDFEDRLAALSEGIGFVERAVDEKLVRYVNILQYQGADNALTSWGQDQIWIYADTFRNQRISELRSMAEHEALHIFTDRRGYSRKAALRGIFSTLHGFGPLTMERFSLVTRGSFPPGVILPTGNSSPLFAFINEKNFIPGMSGGHADDNLDEFCASFLHALLYIDHLSQNIEKAGLFMADGSLRALLPQERKGILRDFRRALELFIASSAADDNLQNPTRLSTRAVALFDKSMIAAREVSLPD
jgi:hypothetical protein